MATDVEARAAAPARTAADWRATVGALLIGAAVVGFLTPYNDLGWTMIPGQMGRTWEEYMVVNVSALMFPAWVFVLALLKEPADRWGFRAPDAGAVRIALVFFLVMVPLILVASRLPTFRAYYPAQPMAAYSWRYLVYYELAFGFYFLCWEWFYRGFLTFGLARALGPTAAVVLQALAFGVMHYGKPAPEFAGSFVAGVALGWLALRARSFLPGFWLHWAIAASFDLLAVHARPGAIF